MTVKFTTTINCLTTSLQYIQPYVSDDYLGPNKHPNSMPQFFVRQYRSIATTALAKLMLLDTATFFDRNILTLLSELKFTLDRAESNKYCSDDEKPDLLEQIEKSRLEILAFENVFITPTSVLPSLPYLIPQDKKEQILEDYKNYYDRWSNIFAEHLLKPRTSNSFPTTLLLTYSPAQREKTVLTDTKTNTCTTPSRIIRLVMPKCSVS